MPEQPNKDAEQHSAFTTFMIEGDRIHETTPVELIAFVATIGTGLVAYHGVHNYVFPGHFEHDEQQAIISGNKASITELEKTKEDLAELNGTAGLDTTDEQGEIDQEIITKQTEIQAQIDHPVPEGYNETADAFVSGGAGVLAFAVAAVASIKVLRRLNRWYGGTQGSTEEAISE